MSVQLLGLRTVIHPVTDLAAATAWWTDLLGFGPYFEEPFYVGFEVAGYELGLLPDAPLPAGADSSGGVADAAAAAADGVARAPTCAWLLFWLCWRSVAPPGSGLARACAEHRTVRVHTAVRGFGVRVGVAARVYGALASSYGHFTTGGIDDRIDSTLPPVLRPKIVPRSWRRLNST